MGHPRAERQQVMDAEPEVVPNKPHSGGQAQTSLYFEETTSSVSVQTFIYMMQCRGLTKKWNSFSPDLGKRILI